MADDTYTLNPSASRALNIARGAYDLPVGVLNLLGMAGVGPAERAAQSMSEWGDKYITPHANWMQDPHGAAQQAFGGSLVALPVGAVNAVRTGLTNIGVSGPVAAGLTRFAELVTPGTAPYTLGNVAANTVVQGAAGAGIDKLVDMAYPQQPVPLNLDGPLEPVPLNLDAPAQPVNVTVSSDPAQAVTSNAPAAPVPLNLDEPVAASEPVPLNLDAQQPGSETARTAVKYLPYALAAVGLGAPALLGVRQAMRAREMDRLAAQSTMVQPGAAIPAFVDRPTLGERTRMNLADQAAVVTNRIDEQARQGVITRQQADADISIVERNLNETSINDRFREMWDTGRTPTGGVIDSSRRLGERLAALRERDPAKVQLWMEGLAARNELDNRNYNLRNRNMSSINSWEPARPGLWHNSMTDLTAMDRRASADPEVRQLMQDYNRITRQIAKYARDEGEVITPNEYNMWLGRGGRHPNYVHTVFSQEEIKRSNNPLEPHLVSAAEVNSPLTRREYGEFKLPEFAQDPMSALEDLMRQTVDASLRNEARRALARSLQNGTMPNGQQFAGGITRVGAHVPTGFTPVVFREKGVPRQIAVIKEIGQVAAPYPKLTIPIFNGARVLAQNMATGLGAAIAGAPFALTSAAMAGYTIAASRTRGMRAGYIDAGLQHATGGKLGMRSDPTFLLAVGREAFTGLAAQSAQSLGNVLLRSADRDGILSKVLGKARAQQIGQDAVAAYHNSLLAQMRRDGTVGGGISFGDDRTPVGMQNLVATMPDYAGGMANLTAKNSGGLFNNISERLTVLGARVIPADLRRSVQFMNQALDIVASSPHAALFRQNKDLPQFHGKQGQDALVGTVRRLSGDPAQFGASKTVQALTSAIPYSNVGIQSLNSVYRSLKKDPVRVGLGLAVPVVVTKLMQYYLAMVADDKEYAETGQRRHVAHLLTAPARSEVNSFYAPIPGVAPQFSPRFYYDQVVAPIGAVVEAVLPRLLGLDHPQYWTDPKYAAMRDHIGDLLDDRQTSLGTEAANMLGAQQATPPLVAAAARGIYGADADGLLTATNPRISIPRDQGAPGYERNQLPGDPMNRWVQAALEETLTVAGTSAVNYLRTMAYADRSPQANGIDAALQQYRLTAAGAQPQLNALFQAPRRMPLNDEISTNVRKLEDRLEYVQQGIAAARGMGGTIGAGRMRLPSEGGLEGVSPDMAVPLNLINKVYSGLAPVREQRNLAMAEIRAAQASPSLRSNPTQMMETINRAADRVRGYNATMYGHYNNLERELSQALGVRFRIDTLDPQRGLDQFSKLN